MATFQNITGQQFGRLRVLQRARPHDRNGTYWLCQCACGATATVNGWKLKHGHTKSCGCLRKELSAERRTTHGISGSTTHAAWNQMIQRCTNPKNKRWDRYGARGISVCDRWNSFELFLADMGLKPFGSTIDRIDNDGNYEPSNCRWTSMRVQANNTSSNTRIKAFGRTQTLMQWSRETGIGHCTISARINRYGWSIERALTTKARPIRAASNTCK